LKNILALEQASHHGQVGPDLRFEHAAAGVEHADHGPARGTEGHSLAEVKALELALQGLADHDLVRAAREHAALDYSDVLTPVAPLLADAAQRQVGLGVGGALQAIDHEIEFWRDQRLAV